MRGLRSNVLRDSRNTGRMTHILNCMWQKGEWVVVVGGVFGKNGELKEPSFTIASILEIGLDDLLVDPKERHSRPKFVPQKSCQRIPVDSVEVYKETRKPYVGDLVYYYRKDWNRALVTSVSHVLELRREIDREVYALINVGDKQIWVPTENLLVLDVNNATK